MRFPAFSECVPEALFEKNRLLTIGRKKTSKNEPTKEFEELNQSQNKTQTSVV